MKPTDMKALDQVIEDRCRSLGITRSFANRLAAEADNIDPCSISIILGLNLAPLRYPRNWLKMAAKTSSVSYRTEISEVELADMLASGVVPSKFTSQILHLLDEAPIQIVVMAIEQVSQNSELPIAKIWQNVHKIAQQLESRRLRCWSATG